MLMTILKTKYTGKHNVTWDDLFNNTIQRKQIIQKITFETKKKPEEYLNTPHITLCKELLNDLNNSLGFKALVADKANINKYYYSFEIPKKTGGFRKIDAPNSRLKAVQYDIVRTLKAMNILEHESAFAYVKNRSCLNALQKHQLNESKWFLKIDLKNFFGSCTSNFVYTQLCKIYPFATLKLIPKYDKIIKDLITICCLDNVLPQGTPISPYLTNLLMVPIDFQLYTLVPVYTRYADDMLFSSRIKKDLDIVSKIKEILKDTPLHLNDAKTRLGSCAGRNWNLGLMYNKDQEITIGYKNKQKLRARIDQFMSNPSILSISEKAQLKGLLSYYHNIEPGYIEYVINKYSTKYRVSLNTLLKM